MASIEVALKHVAKWEGGFTDHSSDKGGRTKYGVTHGALDEARRKRPKAGYPADVADLTLAQAHEIFELDYAPKGWAKIQDQRVATVLLDGCVNHGPHRGVVLMQRALCAIGVGVTVDGKFGPKTLEAINAADPEALLASWHRTREAFYHSIVENDPSQGDFLRGWLNRNNDIPVLA